MMLCGSRIVVVIVAMIVPMSLAYGLSNSNNNGNSNNQQQILTTSSIACGHASLSTTRRSFFLEQIPTAATIFGVTMASSTSPAFAKSDEPEELPTREVVKTTFDAIRYELSDPNGGVSFMQSRIDENDFAGLLEFTKGYDLELRKLRMGKAKKLLQDKEIKGKGTEYANAVTFDLIGMNRSSRSGQENAEMVNKYLQELRDDVSKFLQLESTVQTLD